MTTSIGLTGSMGSGKSLIARVFQELGAEVFYADIEAKKLYEDELFIQLLPYMNAKGKLGILEYFLRKKQISMCLILGKFIFWVKNRSPILFSMFKQTEQK